MKMLRIFDQYFLSTEYAQELGPSAPAGATVMSASALLNKIQNDYPFTLSLSTAQATLQVGQSSSFSSCSNKKW